MPVGPARVAGVVDADHAQAQGVDRWGVAPTEHGRDRAEPEVLAHPALDHERGGGADDRLAGLDRAASLAQPDRTAGALAVHDLARRDQRVTVVEDERVELEPPIWGRWAGRPSAALATVADRSPSTSGRTSATCSTVIPVATVGQERSSSWSRDSWAARR